MMLEPKNRSLMNTFVGVDNNCNMIYLNQNLYTIDRQSVKENCNLFILFEQRDKVLISIYQDFFNNVELSYNVFANICNKVWKGPYNYIVIDISKNKNINGKLRINWYRRVFVVQSEFKFNFISRLDQRCCWLRQICEAASLMGLRPAVLTQMGLRPADYTSCCWLHQM